ncbi:MAG: hypothetical protein EHM70_09665 [Chloroflexota bacterium]|nr:MAG: hypothetical protein EHM70_09665 [Chloroflexota bacterium]
MKELAFKIAAGIVVLNGLGELAVSQVHILASTKVFASEIGMYLFLFIIFGVVTSFNIFLLNSLRGLAFFSVSSWVSAAAGYIYLKIMLADVAAQESLTIADVQDSWLLVVVSICICLAGSLAIPLLRWEDAKGMKI